MSLIKVSSESFLKYFGRWKFWILWKIYVIVIDCNCLTFLCSKCKSQQERTAKFYQILTLKNSKSATKIPHNKHTYTYDQNDAFSWPNDNYLTKSSISETRPNRAIYRKRAFHPCRGLWVFEKEKVRDEVSKNVQRIFKENTNTNENDEGK